MENSAATSSSVTSPAASATSICRLMSAHPIRNLTDISRARGRKIDILAEPAKSANSDPETESRLLASREVSAEIRCPVCGAVAVQEKCKVICRSETCRRRVVMNCSEF